MGRFHAERHLVSRVGWLRAAVLGANDGIISISSLIVGVAASAAGKDPVLLSGTAALVAGAMSMAAGEFVSVSSQADAERADLHKERIELKTDPVAELAELSAIYQMRGLTQELADKVATQLTAHDALAAHARDELGLGDGGHANPVQAALASGASFLVGAAPPLVLAAFLPLPSVVEGITVFALLLLAALGAIGAKLGGANALKGCLRVAGWGAAALVATGLIGHLFGSVGG